MGYRSHKIRRLWVKIEICITCFANNREWEEKKANERKFNYKKERGPKISHFWSPKESSYGLEEKKKRPRKVWNLYGFMTLSMESCVFWTLVGIFMVSKPRV